MRSAGIAVLVVLCGWVVMQTEILGARVLAPYFGSAVYVVMGSVIGVFLLSLAGGYMLGGWLSGSTRSRPMLGACLAAAGLWYVFMPSLTQPVCDGLLDAGFDSRWGSLVAALALFAVPTLLLGTVSPVVVRWLTRGAGDSGFKAGVVLAVSTAASFLGCVVTAFYIVLLSVSWTFRVSGGVLLLVGLVMLVPSAVSSSAHVPASPQPAPAEEGVQ